MNPVHDSYRFLFSGLVCLLLTGTMWGEGPLQIAELEKGRAVSFQSDVLPALKKNCIACHNESLAESGVNLESPLAMKESENSDLLVPGTSMDSGLFLVASHHDEPVMPPVDNDVSAESFSAMELALLKRWIDSGALDDQKAKAGKSAVWQALPSNLKTALASAITDDGRLTAVSSANEIRVFGTKDNRPIDSLAWDTSEGEQPPHKDVVQDLCFVGEGGTLVSAGYRNIKVWQRSPFLPRVIPAIKSDETLATKLSHNGRFVASLSKVGEVSVATVGKPRWDWLRGFDLPEGVLADGDSTVQMAVHADGNLVALAFDRLIKIVRSDGDAVGSIDAGQPVSSVIFTGEGSLISGHEDGSVMHWRLQDDQWVSVTDHTLKKTVAQLICLGTQSYPLLAIDQSGTFALYQETLGKSSVGSVGTPVERVALGDSRSFWITAENGRIGSYDLDKKSFVEFAKHDPSAESKSNASQWERMVGERLVAAFESELKKTQEEETAERTSLEKSKVELKKRQKAKAEKLASQKATQETLSSANGALEKAKANTKSIEKKRISIEKKLADAKTSAEGLQEKLSEAKKQRDELQESLNQLPDAKSLSETVAKAQKSVDESAKKSSEAIAALETAEAAVLQTVKANERTETRIEQLLGEVKEKTERVESEKKVQAERVQEELSDQQRRDASSAGTGSCWPVPELQSFVVKSSTGDFHLWSKQGDWMAKLDSISPTDAIVDSGKGCLLVRKQDGRLMLLGTPSRHWSLAQAVGSPDGDSVFADRVTAMDFDAHKQMLATGGGAPSRSGEVMLWELLDDNTLSHKLTLDQPHSDTVLSVSFSPDGKCLATAGADRLIKLWDAKTGAFQKTLEGHTHHVTSIAWSVTGRQLYSASADKSVKVWDVATAKSSRTIKGLKSEVTKLAALGRDGRIGFVGGDGHFRVYRSDNGARETDQLIQPGYLYGLATDRTGTRFIVSGVDGLARLIEKSGKSVLQYE